jgi:uncharacterized protein (DUF58 family)
LSRSLGLRGGGLSAPAGPPLRERLARWLFRSGGPEPAPIVLGQRRVFVLPTRHVVVFGASLVLLLIGSINYALSLGYLLTFLLAGLGVVAIVHVFRNLAGLEISPGRTEPAFAGTRCTMSLLLANRRHEPRRALLLQAARAEPLVVGLPGAGVEVASFVLQPQRRGWLRLGRVTIETRFPLGLIRAWSYVEPELRCLVYPAPEADPPPLPAGAAGGWGSFAGSRGSEDFSGLRSYQPADSPRHVAWKQVARDAPPLTKQFAGGTSAESWLDWAALPASLGTEARLSRLTAWVLAADLAGARFGLRLPGRELPCASGARHVRACLEALALHGEG